MNLLRSASGLAQRGWWGTGGTLELSKSSSELTAGGMLLGVQIPSRYISILRLHGLSKMTFKNRNQPASTDASSQLTQNLGA